MIEKSYPKERTTNIDAYNIYNHYVLSPLVLGKDSVKDL